MSRAIKKPQQQAGARKELITTNLGGVSTRFERLNIARLLTLPFPPRTWKQFLNEPRPAEYTTALEECWEPISL